MLPSSADAKDAKSADVTEAEVPVAQTPRPETNMEGLAVRSVEEIHEPIDPRFHLTSELDLAAHNFPHHHHGHGEASEETTEKTSGATTSTRSGTKDLEGFEKPLYVSAWFALCSRAPQVPYPIP